MENDYNKCKIKSTEIILYSNTIRFNEQTTFLKVFIQSQYDFSPFFSNYF